MHGLKVAHGSCTCRVCPSVHIVEENFLLITWMCEYVNRVMREPNTLCPISRGIKPHQLRRALLSASFKQPLAPLRGWGWRHTVHLQGPQFSMSYAILCTNFLRYCPYQPLWLPCCPFKSLLCIVLCVSPTHTHILTFSLPVKHLLYFVCRESKSLRALCFPITHGEGSWGGVLQKEMEWRLAVF